MALTPHESLLVTRHVAALRAQGWPCGRALEVVAGGLPEGPGRAELTRIAAALGRGEQPAAGGDPLLELLARGERAGSRALLEAAQGFELARRAQAALLTLRGLAFTSALAATLVAAGLAVGVPAFFVLVRDFGSALPAPTQFLFDLGPALPVAGWLFALAAVLAGLRPPRFLRRLAGAVAYETAGRLRLAAGALEAGLDETTAAKWLGATGRASLVDAPALGLDGLERQLASVVKTQAPAELARLWATERERAGARASAVFRHLAPLAVLVGIGLVVGLTLIALYLPIFSIAGAVK